MARTVWLLVIALIVGTVSALAIATTDKTVELRDSFIPAATNLEKEVIGFPSANGIASFYDATKNNAWYTRGDKPTLFYAAAGPALRALCKGCDFKWGKPPYRVLITNRTNGRSIVAWVVDWCQCSKGKNQKLIDLAPAAWAAVAGPEYSMSRGLLKVKVEVLP
jgi:hypothetical protein